MTALGVQPRLTHDATEPGLIVTSTVDRFGQRLLHLLNIGPTVAEFALTFLGRPVFAGRRLRLPARTGVMLPHGVRVGGATLLESTCELAGLAAGEVTLRPTQAGDVAAFDTRPTTVDGGEVATDGDRYTVTARSTDPIRVRFA
jgi:beta-galactosidase